MKTSHTNRAKRRGDKVLWDSATRRKGTQSYTVNGESRQGVGHTYSGNGVKAGRLSYLGVGQYSQSATSSPEGRVIGRSSHAAAIAARLERDYGYTR